MTDVAELLNAYLDGELSDAETETVEARLAASPELEQDLAELRATRSLLRSLPDVAPERPIAVPPPSGPQRRSARRWGLAVGAVAAVWLLIFSVGVSLGSLPVVPDVDQLATQHASASPPDMDFQEMTYDQMADDPAILDDIGHGMSREAIFQSGELVQVRYSDGDHAVSVFHEQGRVDWDSMPESGKVSMMAEGPVWASNMGDVDVLVTERGDLVVTIVADGDMDHEMTMAASTMVPPVDKPRGFLDRLFGAPRNLLDRF